MRIVGLLVLAVLPATIAGAQTRLARHEIVRGRITTDSARDIANATVIVTRITDHQFKSTTTGDDGRYSIDWPDGTGEYVVYVRALGFGPLSHRVARSGRDSTLVADFTLTRGATALAAVVVTAQATPRNRDGATRNDVGSSGHSTFTQNADRRLAADQAGDLAAIAALGTGVMPVAGGISVLGLGAAQNSVTLNGLAFAAVDIPRDAATRVRVTSSSYDPSIGWFSGARTQVDLLPGDLFTTRTGHVTFDTPAAQWNDPVSAHLGQRFTNFNGSIGGTGQLVDDEWSYNYGLQGGRKSSDFASLTTADATLLQHAGLSADSASRFTQLLKSASIASGAAGASLGRLDDNVSFIGRIDHAPYDWATLQAAKTTWGLTGYAKWARTQGLGLGPTATLSHAGESTVGIGSVQAEWSTYFANDFLTDIRSSGSLTRNATSPNLSLPDASVLVASAFPDGTSGVSTVLFGGNSGLRTEARAGTWESIADLQLYSPGPVAHKVRVTADLRFDAVWQDVGTNALGSYTFNSLADLSANQPSAFTRAINSPTRTGAAWNAFAAIGDVWHVSPDLLLNYGARAEGNVFADAPAYNAAVESVFGVRTDHAPNTAAISPRLGFLYNVPGPDGRPAGSIHGGAGEFRNLIDPSLLAAPSVATGLPNGAGQLACFGAATPRPNWPAIAASSSAIPTACANGAGPAFIDSAPAVRVMAPPFTAARSWRANLAWSSTALRSAYSIEGTISENLNQRGTEQLNFIDVKRFVTADEGRPIFVNPQSIVPATGVVSPVDARRSSVFGTVNEGITDLRSESRQATLDVRPFLGSTISPFLTDFVVGYTLASIRDQERGFDQSTFGDPSARDVARGALDARHQFVVQGVVHIRPGLFLFVAGRAQSGTPYTPMVRTDVNGDGLANDRAYVFDPSAPSIDPSLAAGMRDLLATTSAGARDCLLRQMGGPAARSSCEGPWSTALTTSLRISGQQFLHAPRMDVAIGLNNPLGGLDQLLHGTNNLHGWGTQPAPDRVLLDVRGFDAANTRFVYAVNPRFGSTSATTNTIRAPFRLTLDVSLDLAPPQTKQQMTRWLGPGKSAKGSSITAADLARRFQRTVTDPYAELIDQADSLLLTPPQVTALRDAERGYRTRVDSIWTSLSAYLVSLPDANAAVGTYRLTDDATDDAWEITRQSVRRDFPTILTPDQLTLLSGMGRYLFNASSRVHIRIYPRGG